MQERHVGREALRGELFAEVILNGLDVVARARLDGLNARRRLTVKSLCDRANGGLLILVERRHLRHIVTRREAEQPFHLDTHSGTDERRLRERHGDIRQLPGVSPVER